MSDPIDGQSSKLLKNHRQYSIQLNKAMKELGTGKRVDQPGDDVAAFQDISELKFGASTEAAQLEVAQSRMSWYQASSTYLQEVSDILGAMSSLAVQASSSTAGEVDLVILDQSFQEYKKQISEFVDGQGGTESVAATFRGRPLFIGYAPPTEIGSHVSVPSDLSEAVNLYTGYKRHGFDSLPLVNEPGSGETGPVDITQTGTARGGSTSTLQLAAGSTTIPNAYLGMTVAIDGGTGSGQTSTIVGYEGDTQTATVEPPFTVAPDATSTYTITHHTKNYTLKGTGNIVSLPFAEHVWGADADRFEKQSVSGGTFRALTEEERDYRVANGVAETDLEAKTDAERLERRKRNIFDPEFGTLRTLGDAERMLRQVGHAQEKITYFLTILDSKAEAIRSNLDHSSQRMSYQEQGVSSLGDAEPWKAAADLQEAMLKDAKMAGLAARMSENLARLNELVRNQGQS